MSEAPLAKQTVDVRGRRMAYHSRGEGRPILFLHGNPTSSYLWRDVIPELEGHGQLIAPDLIGMGESDKLPDPKPDTYRFTTHRDFLDGFIDAVIGPSESVALVVHDWGSALGFDWANRHRDRVRGIAYMEAIVRPVAGWEEWSPSATPVFQGFRSDKGEQMILDRNLFVERVLPGSVLRKLTDAEMAEYRKPFEQREDRWPTLTWPREIPIAGEPADVERLIAFAVAGFAFILGYPRHWILVVCLVVGSAFAFEAAQLLSPSRHAHLHDAAIKAIGGVVGILAGAVFNFFRPSLFQAPGED